ncbi:uncharacterized protein IUM83_18338 [Phytophthora cinnamomi]|uniref:uncharacterized protein n=1 Tax=Phytophthora cinnamomi TaxID=4785 RepID=UPI003559FE40|nr:hypothetical protein IUM83_18338 [Phytophthora cinnamomi]
MSLATLSAALKVSDAAALSADTAEGAEPTTEGPMGAEAPRGDVMKGAYSGRGMPLLPACLRVVDGR